MCPKVSFRVLVSNISVLSTESGVNKNCLKQVLLFFFRRQIKSHLRFVSVKLKKTYIIFFRALKFAS